MPSEQAVNGYALWLEPAHLHFHHGDKARVKVLWGRAMKREQLDKPFNWTGLVVDPAGLEIMVPVTMDKDGFNYELVFDGGPEGIYTVQVEGQDGDNIYCARVLVPFGHHVHGGGVALNRGLEIVPASCDQFHPGDTIDLTVLADGRPQPGVRVAATYHIYDGDGFVHERETDQHGKLSFTFDARGHWMFQTRHGNGKNHVATLVVPGVR